MSRRGDTGGAARRRGKPPPWVAIAFAACFGAGAIVTALTAGYAASVPLVLGSLHCFDVSYGRRNSVVEVVRLLLSSRGSV